MEWGHKVLTLSWLIMAPFDFPEVPDYTGKRERGRERGGREGEERERGGGEGEGRRERN